MIEILGAPISGADLFEVEGRVVLQDLSGVGIRKVTGRDRYGLEVFVSEPGCPLLTEVVVPRVERDRLPLFIQATDCSEDGSPQEPIPIWVLGETQEDSLFPLPPSVLRCEDSPSCDRAQNEAQRLRNELLAFCGRIEAIAGRRNGYASAAAVMFALLAAMLATVSSLGGVPIIGWILAAIAVAVALVALVSGIMLGYLANQEQERLNQVQSEMAERRERFTDTIDEVLARCSRSCITISLDVPTCGG